MNLSGYCIAEYSHSQNKFHCDFIEASIRTNIQSIKDNNANDWITIGIFKTWEETQKFIEETKKRINYPNNKQ